MKTILQIVVGVALLQPHPQEKPTWVKVDDVSHQQYNQEFPVHQDRLVDFILRSDSTHPFVYEGDDRTWVALYSPNKDTMLVLPSDAANDAFTIWVRQQHQQ